MKEIGGKMKKMKIRIGILMVAVLLLTSTASAEIFDSVNMTGNRILTAKLGLEINGTVPFNITNIEPGINQTQTMNIRNNGTISENLIIEIMSLTGLENINNLTVEFETNKTIISGLKTGELFNCSLSPEETILLNTTVFPSEDINQSYTIEFDLKLNITNRSWWWTAIIANNSITAGICD